LGRSAKANRWGVGVDLRAAERAALIGLAHSPSSTDIPTDRFVQFASYVRP
jgi:hypothetical protein